MEEVKEEVQAKPELKEEYISPLLESGVDVDSIITTIKKEDGEFIEALVNVTKEEEKHPVKFDSDTKPSILTSLVKVCSGRDVNNDHNDQVLKNKNEIKANTEEENYGEEFVSSAADTSHQADSEERVEENYDSDGPEGDFRGLAYWQNTPDKPSSPPQENPAGAKRVKKYMCEYCDKRFKDRHILKSHTRTHTGERPFECSFCCKRFISKTLLNLHTYNHTGRRFCCSICGKRFIQSQGLKMHMLIHEEKRPFKCAHCGINIRQKPGLLRHIRRMHMRPQKNKEIHSDKEKLIPCESVESNHSPQQRGNNDGLNKRFKNSVSGNTSTCRDDLMEHVNDSHSVNRFTCDDCGETFKCRQNIIEHMETEHSFNRFICDDCGKTFKCKQSIIYHMRNVHFQENKGQYCCKICGMESTNKFNLKKHEQIHNDVYPFKCEHCNMSFKQKISLKSHYRQVHNSGKPYKCVDCGSCFKMKYNLVAHIEVHHRNKEEMFFCHICSMKFKRKCYLKRHIETHTDADKKYVCDECGLRCRSKTDIAKHVQTHFGTVERPHTCEECGAGFSKPSHLVRHRRVHSDERTFRCQLCDKAFKDTSSLKIHHETVHCGASFLCKVCGFSSVNRQSFNRHRRMCQD